MSRIEIAMQAFMRAAPWIVVACLAFSAFCRLTVWLKVQGILRGRALPSVADLAGMDAELLMADSSIPEIEAMSTLGCPRPGKYLKRVQVGPRTFWFVDVPKDARPTLDPGDRETADRVIYSLSRVFRVTRAGSLMMFDVLLQNGGTDVLTREYNPLIFDELAPLFVAGDDGALINPDPACGIQLTQTQGGYRLRPGGYSKADDEAAEALLVRLEGTPPAS